MNTVKNDDNNTIVTKESSVIDENPLVENDNKTNQKTTTTGNKRGRKKTTQSNTTMSTEPLNQNEIVEAENADKNSQDVVKKTTQNTTKKRKVATSNEINQEEKNVDEEKNIIIENDEQKTDVESEQKTDVENEEKTDEVKILNPSDEEQTTEVPLLVTESKKERKKKDKKVEEEKVIERYPHTKEGLTAEQVQKRIDDNLVNVVTKTNEKSYLQIILSNTFTFFNTLCFIIGILMVVVYAKKGILGKNYTNLLFVVIILCNLTIGIIQEIKAKITIRKIKLMVNPSAMVIRDGKENKIPVTELVLDDVVLLDPGKQIPADLIMIEGELEVNESLLTGESVPVKKRKNAELYSGSFVVSGKAKAYVNKIGDDCYNAKLASKAKKYKKPNSELLRSMNIITKIVGIIIIPLTFLTLIDLVFTEIPSVNVFSKEWFNTIWENLDTIITNLAGSMIGMIPAGMFLLTSMALAVGVLKLAKKRTLVHDLYSIEMLARADVLCLDKTGTITDGTMKVQHIVQLNLSYCSSLNDIIGSMLSALNDNNQTTLALANYFGYNTEYSPKAIIPFTSARKYSAVTFRNGETYMYGAPEYVLKNRDPEMEKQIKIFTKKGFRVLLFAKCEGEITDGKIGQEREPICLIIIEDHIREDAQRTIKWFKENNVEVKVISGDNPITVSEVSKRVGIDKADLYISLEGLSEQQVIDAVDDYTVFGRVTPEQKCILVKALKAKGHKVAMTGDGVNDILALKEADCSIAMASGSEAARNVSNLVLLDNNFNSMPSVVAEGRRVVNNVQNASSIFLVKTLFNIIITILFLILPNASYPFKPQNFLMIELFMSGLPTFFLALQPNDDIIKGNFLANLIAKIIPGGMVMSLSVILCYIINILLRSVTNFTPSDTYLTSMCCLVLIFTGMIILYTTCKPINFYRGCLLVCDFIALFIFMFFIPNVFTFDLGFKMLDATDVGQLVYILLTLIVLLIAYPTYNSLLKISNKVKDKIVN